MIWVSRPGLFTDPAEVPSKDDHEALANRLNEHEEKLTGHDTKLDEHGQNIGWLWDKVNKHNSGIGEIGGKVGDLNARIDGLPVAVRDSLDHTLREILGDKLEIGEKILKDMREERQQVAKQLEELRQQRESLQAQLQKLKDQCDLTKAKLEEMENRVDKKEKDGKHLIDDYSMQVAEVKLSVPVPKKFAKFLFVQAKADAETEV